MDRWRELRQFSIQPKRARSDIEGLYLNSVPLKLLNNPEKQSTPKVPIRISKNKLPPDFFPATEEKRNKNIRKILLQQEREHGSKLMPQRA